MHEYGTLKAVKGRRRQLMRKDESNWGTIYEYMEML
jgi:hypothetical protein